MSRLSRVRWIVLGRETAPAGETTKDVKFRAGDDVDQGRCVREGGTPKIVRGGDERVERIYTRHTIYIAASSTIYTRKEISSTTCSALHSILYATYSTDRTHRVRREMNPQTTFSAALLLFSWIYSPSPPALARLSVSLRWKGI